MYISVFIVLAFSSLMNGFFRKKENISFIVMSIFLIIISSIRYGSGTDYFGYLWNYRIISPGLFNSIIDANSHFEVGFKGMIGVFKSLNINFEIFVMFIAICTLAMYIYTIWKNSNYKILSIFMLYSLYYHVYVTSALRQTFAMGIFFVAYYTFIKKEKILNFIIIVLIGSLFHKAILITLIIPIIHNIYKKMFYNVRFNGLLIGLALLGLIFHGDRIINLIGYFFGVTIYYTGERVSFMAIMVRVVFGIYVYILYCTCYKDTLSEFDKFQIYTYFIGILIYIFISNNTLFSRFTDVLSILEIIIIPNLIVKSRIKNGSLILVLCIMILSGVLFIKDIYACIDQGGYYNKQVLSYPYVTIFNKRDIFNYRYVPSVHKDVI